MNRREVGLADVAGLPQKTPPDASGALANPGRAGIAGKENPR